MESMNPYSPPPISDAPPAYQLELPRRQLWDARFFVLGSVVFGCLYTFFDEVILQTSIGAWPMLFASSAIAIAANVFTRNLVLSPFCCIAGTVSGDLIAAMVRDWQYAQMHLCVPLAIGFSIPSLLLGLYYFLIDTRRKGIVVE